MIRTKTVIVRALDGRTIHLLTYCIPLDDNNSHGEPPQITTTLRLRRRPKLPEPAAMPPDLLLRICSFLSVEDWLAFDSTCKGWKEVRRFLWLDDEENEALWTTTQNNRLGQRLRMLSGPAKIYGEISVGTIQRRTTTRRNVASLRYARRKLQKTWSRLKGFLPKQITLNGPASDGDIAHLKQLVLPWSLPPAFIASWKLHNGEWDKSQGMYLGSRMLEVQEIAAEIKESLRETEKRGLVGTEGSGSYGTRILRIPLFSEIRARQVAMELRMHLQSNIDTIHDHYCQDSSSKMECQDCKIVLVNSLVPSVPHIKVLANSWEGFLTLV